MPSLQEVAAQRMSQLAKRPAAQPLTDAIHRDSSLEKPEVLETPAATNKWDEANLPAWLWPYVQNRSWAIRFANLLNQGYAAELRNLAEHVAKTAHTNATRMMAKACSKAMWEESVKLARERLAVERTAAQVRERLGLVEATAKQARAIYKAVWRLKQRVVRYAVAVQEMHAAKRLRTDRFKFFCWLTSPAAVAKERAYAAQPYAAWPA